MNFRNTRCTCVNDFSKIYQFFVPGCAEHMMSGCPCGGKSTSRVQKDAEVSHKPKCTVLKVWLPLLGTHSGFVLYKISDS